ncbi:MAG: ACT domain-containing protein, partial [Thermodesulfobacteriota bacterium]
MAENQNLLMVVVSGKDRPGIVAGFTRILMNHNIEIVDIEQASLQNLLGLYFILDLSKAGQSHDSVIKDLLFEASCLNLTLNFRLYSPKEMQA